MAPFRFAVLLVLATAGAHASEFPPVTNHAMLARGFTLPSLGHPPAGTASRWQWSLDLTNEYESLGFNANGQCADPECLRVDGETRRLAVRHQRRFAPGWDWSVEVPLVAHAGGSLDGIIETWHGWFGLPNNGRELQPRDQFRVFYSSDGQVLLDYDEPRSGLGDVSLGIGRDWGRWALRGEAKLPTGDSARLSGGNAGVALWLAGETPRAGRWRGYVAAGASLNRRGELLPQQQNRLVPLGGAGLSVAVSPRLRLQAQLYAHGPLFANSRLRNLGRAGLLLSVGGQFALTPSASVELALIEDLGVNVSPDFNLQWVLRWGG